MKGDCFIDIDGIYDYHCLLTFLSYQSKKIIGLLKVCFLSYLFIYLFIYALMSVFQQLT
jgi:hypothetical protein